MMNELAVCESLSESAHPLGMITYSENRPRWHNERRQAKVNVRPRSSLSCFSGSDEVTEEFL